MQNGFRYDLISENIALRAELHNHAAYAAAMDCGSSDLCVYSLDDLISAEKAEELAQTEDQMRMSSCGGHGGTTSFERAVEVYLGVRHQYSRMYLYLRGKARNRYTKRGDGGMMISDGVAQLMEGCCLEATFPYTGQFSEFVPAGADEEAKQHRLGSAVDILQNGDPNDFAQRFLGHNMGAIYHGSPWTSCLHSPRDGVCGPWSMAGNLGGHAYALVGLSPRTDSRGRHYYWLSNSHGMSYGKRGFSEMPPDTYAAMCHPELTESFGISKPAVPEKRLKFDFDLG